MFLHLSVSHSVHRRGAYPSACWDTPPPWADTPLGRHPWADNPTSRWLLLRKVRILLECILVLLENYQKKMKSFSFFEYCLMHLS